VKAAMVSRELARRSDVKEIIIHTGQHFDENMSDIFFKEMAIPKPHYNFDIHSLKHGAMTGKMLEKIEEALSSERPDYVLVYGDTDSTLAGALAAKKLHLSVVHVEAGLRSFKMAMPEEVNRILTDRLSDILCCPTKKAQQNLFEEGYSKFPVKISITGDVMQDAALSFAKVARSHSRIIERLELATRPFAVCTVHRAENTDDVERLKSLVAGINALSSELLVVFPMHPRTRDIMAKYGITFGGLTLDPLGYFDMVSLVDHCSLVLTDSGGLQKEAFFFGKPCVTLRNETEWVELLEGGFNTLAGTDSDSVISASKRMLSRKLDFATDLYGQGTAAGRIVDLMVNA
jgi:UDP-GlcNAc3NAcA epimerase